MPVQEKKVYDADVEANRLFAALSYAWLLCLFPLVFRRHSKFAQFHAKQGFVLMIVELILGLVMWIPVIGQIIFLIVLIMSIVGFIKAYNGEHYKMPFIHQWSEKLKI